MARPIAIDETDRLFAPLLAYRRLVLAVSGGGDSVALMHLASAWERREGGPKPELAVLTVDHGLRPEATAEAALAASQAASLGLEHSILPWAGPKPVRAIEAAARAARYDLMAAWCHASGFDGIVTAHHLDDQAETLLMRLARGSGVDGLSAMPTVGAWAGIPVLRPLLDLPKARLRATLDAAAIRFATDATNDDPRFERSRLRGSRAAFDALGLTAAALGCSAKRLRRARDALDRVAETFLATHARVNGAGYAEIAREAVLAAPEEIALRALSRLLGSVGGAAEAPRLRAVETLLEGLSGGGKGSTLAGCRIEAQGADLRIMRECRRPGLPELHLAPGGRALWDRRILVSLAEDAEGPALVRALGADGLSRLKAAGTVPPLPRPALLTVASFWCADALVAVPQIGLLGPHDRRSARCHAAFADRRLVAGTTRVAKD